MSILAATEKDIAAIAKTDPALAESSLAALALSLAGTMDDPKCPRGPYAMCANQLLAVTNTLRELATPPKAKDHVDELRERRADRRAKAQNRRKAEA